MNVEIRGLGGISAKIIEHSSHPVKGARELITLQLRYPRFIHAEFMTHRVFSRNASSSRAIPVAKMIEQVRDEPAMPMHWGKNQPGMQAREELTGEELRCAREAWKTAAVLAATQASIMNSLGVHKQVANRILEPFQFMSVIVTATEWDNFFELRDHEDAEPNIQELACVMKQAIEDSKPRMLQYGEWHLPYVTSHERKNFSLYDLRRLSAARCARVSYLTHDGAKPEAAKDFDLFEKLVGSTPIHASPIEHQATPAVFHQLPVAGGDEGWQNPELWGNLQQWTQFRKLHERGLAAKVALTAPQE